jgi:hypothetical protein
MTTPQLAVEYVAVLSMPLKVILQVKSEIVNGKRHQAQENSQITPRQTAQSKERIYLAN